MSVPKLEEMLDAPTGERIGYARVSTDDQNLDLQVRALERVKCLRIFTEKLSATKKRRPELDEAIKNLRPGDTFVVWRLDRLARGIPELYERLRQIAEKEAGFMSLMEPGINFNTAMGKLLLGVFGVFAEFERNLTIERTRAGLAAARARGAQLGGEMKMTPERIEAIRQRVLSGETATAAAKAEGVSMASFYGAFPGGRKAILASKPKD